MSTCFAYLYMTFKLQSALVNQNIGGVVANRVYNQLQVIPIPPGTVRQTRFLRLCINLKPLFISRIQTTTLAGALNFPAQGQFHGFGNHLIAGAAAEVPGVGQFDFFAADLV